MTVRQAAEKIGCSDRAIRFAITSGRLPATQVHHPFLGNFAYDIDPNDLRAFADRPQQRGWQRGQKRKDK